MSRSPMGFPNVDDSRRCFGPVRLRRGRVIPPSRTSRAQMIFSDAGWGGKGYEVPGEGASGGRIGGGEGGQRGAA